MPLVQVKCTNCSAFLEVDLTKDALICKYCGATFVMEKAVINEQPTNAPFYIGSINGQNVPTPTIDNLFKRVEFLLNLNYQDEKKRNEVLNCCKHAMDISPNDFKALLLRKLSSVKSEDELNRYLTISYFLNYLSKEYQSYIEQFRREECSGILAAIENIFKKMTPTGKINWYDFTYEGRRGNYSEKCQKYIHILENNLFFSYANEEMNEKRYKLLIDMYKGQITAVKETLSFARGQKNIDIEPYYNYINEYQEKINFYSLKINPNYVLSPLAKAGCYIATAVYGSYECPQVWTLRRYRDDILAKTWYGIIFINIYYTFSPVLVKLFCKTKWFKKICKKIIDTFIKELDKRRKEYII